MGLSVFGSSPFVAMKRSAFTLIELLVVIAVVTILATMLLVAVNRARETARRSQCLVQQRDLVTAMITYDKEYNGLPGYLNQLGTAPIVATPIHSWAVAIFPMIGETKRYEFLMKSSPVSNEVAQAIVPLPALLCPSDKPEGNARLNYVVNCGPEKSVEITGDIAPAFTLFKDRRSLLTSVNINKKVKIEDIPDGASHTILSSENVDARVWHADWTTSPDELEVSPSGSGVFTRDSEVVRSLGFIWGSSNFSNFAPNSPTPGTRPSSKHPGTVNVGYADGSAKPMNDDIGITEYLRAVCPDDPKYGI